MVTSWVLPPGLRPHRRTFFFKKGWEMYSQIRKPAYAKMLGEMFGCSSEAALHV